jgi:hypothetical protein
MARSLLFSLFLCLAAASPVPQNQYVPDGQCCFALQDTLTGSILQQSKAGGYVYFNGGFPNGWYCIEPYNDRKLLWDDYGNTCFVNPEKQFVCLDPTPSGDKWTLVKQNNSRILARNGDSTFWACPVKTGVELVFVPQKADKTGCRKLNLKANTLKGAC